MNKLEMVDFTKEEYKTLCEEMKSVLGLEKELAARKAKLKDKIVEMAGGERLEFGIQVSWRIRKGTIDYKGLLKSLKLPDSLLDLYRKADLEYWEVKSY